MNPNDLMWKYRFAILCIPADGEGGGASNDGSGSDAGAGAGEGAAGDPPASAAASETAPKTFLNEAAAKLAEPKLDAEGKPVVEEGGEAKAEEAPAAFDLAAVKLPEGVELDADVGKSFSDILANAELSPQERGQQLLDLHTTALKAAAESAVEQVKAANLETYTKMNDAWRKEIPNLPEFKDNPEAEGGKVFQALISIGADQKFFDALDLTGAGNNPEILRVLHRLTKPYMEGGAVTGTGAAAQKKELGANIYTSTKP